MSKPPLFFLRMEMCSFSSSQKEIAVKGTMAASSFPLSLRSGNGEMDRCTWVGIIVESVAPGPLPAMEGFSVPPPR